MNTKTLSGWLCMAAWVGGGITSSLLGATVAWWPLSFENGTRTTTETVLPNIAAPGTLDARPVSMTGATIVEGSGSCPQGAPAFASGWGVWDCALKRAETGAQGLYFEKTTPSGVAGALRIANPAALRLPSFTFETFFKMQEGTVKSEWNCLAVMPGKLKTSGGANVVNFDSWGVRVTSASQIQIRFTSSAAMATDIENVGSYNKTLNIGNINPYDGKWHHLAFSVANENGAWKAHGYFDYAYKNSVELPADGICYGTEDLFIGSTPQTSGPFGGTIAHVRISDTVLNTSQFLKPTDIAGETEDVMFHADMETPEGFAFGANTFLNRAYGEIALRQAANGIGPATAEDPAVAGPVVYSSVLAQAGVPNLKTMTCPGAANSFVKFTPDAEFDFRREPFTVECFYKTTQTDAYVPIVRRLGGSNVQFNIGLGGTAGRLSATVLEYYQSTGKDGAKAVNDTIATNDGEWHHAALIVNPAKKRMSLYRDGILVGEQSYNGVLVPHTSAVCIGGVEKSGVKSFNGAIDNVRITKRALGRGEFLSLSNFVPDGSTIGWVRFEDGYGSSSGVLTDGVAEKATADGNVPALVPNGRNPRLLDGNGNVLCADNAKCAVFDKGSVKYPENIVLPLSDELTIEFFARCGVQDQYAGLLRCNTSRNSADIPAWALSMAPVAADGTQAIQMRCSIEKEDGSVVDRAINESTGVVVADGKWHHIAFSMKTFRNEESVLQTTFSIRKDYADDPQWTKTVDGSVYYGDGSASVWLGASSTATSHYKGELDEIRVSNRALGVGEMLRAGRYGLVLKIR